MTNQQSEPISKIDAARRQLRTAIRMFFAEGEVISTHTLAAAAHGILRDLGQDFRVTDTDGVELQGSGSYVKDNPLIKPEGKALLNKTINKAQNFFKHAKKDPEGRFDFDRGLTEVLLFDCCLMYRNITGRETHEGRIFLGWFMLKYPKILWDETAKQYVQESAALGVSHENKSFFNLLVQSDTPISGTH